MNGYELRRYEANLSLIEAARLSGVGRTTISRLENGHTTQPSAGVIAKLAKAYRVTIPELLGVEHPESSDHKAAAA
jgi:transcriptional regulator with XRE-family HTH domain